MAEARGFPETGLEDVMEILNAGISQTAEFMDRLKAKGWTNEQIVPVAYQLLLQGRLKPDGTKIPFKAN